MSKAFQVTPGLGKCTKLYIFKFSFTVSRVNEALATLTATQSPFRQWGKGIFVYSPRKLEFKELEHLPQLSKIIKKYHFHRYAFTIRKKVFSLQYDF